MHVSTYDCDSQVYESHLYELLTLDLNQEREAGHGLINQAIGHLRNPLTSFREPDDIS